jgi:hypothetical protein
MKYIISQQPMNGFERMKASIVGTSHICTASDLALPNLDSLAILENLIELYTSVAAFLSRFFIAWEIKYIKPPTYLAR